MIIVMKVVGIGQCSLDYLFVIDSFPVPDTKKEINDWTTAGGGPVATALVSLSRLGINCSFYGVVGDDNAGESIVQSLESENIDTGGMVRRNHSHSQVAFIAIDSGTGQRTIFWKRPSGNALSIDELSNDFLVDADFLHLDGLMRDISIHAAQKARENKIPIMLDAGHLRDGMLDLARLSDYVVASEEFAKAFVGSDRNFDPMTAIKKMSAFEAKAVTITLGKRGSVTLHDHKVFHIPAFSVEVIDTTGAGDVFHGGYIYALLQKWGMEKVVRFASAFAALKCKKLGGRAGIPNLVEVESLLNKFK